MVVIILAISYVIQFKRQYAASWENINPVLKRGEPGFEFDTGRFKIGDGSTPWNDLGYSSLDHEEDGVVLTTDESIITASMMASGAITNDSVSDDAAIDVSKLSGVVSQNSGSVTTAPHDSNVVRNIKASTSSPSGGSDGDVWLVYIP